MKRVAFIFLLFILASSLYSQSGWIKCTSNTSEFLTGVSCNESGGLWAVGGTRDEIPYVGKIIHSTNSGQSWYSQTSGTTKYLRDVFFYDANKGWAVGYDGIILKTTNGGSSWQNCQHDSSYTFFSVYFLNESVGWACGTEASIIKTTDGGATWQIMNTDAIRSPATGRKPKLRSIHFTNSKSGWAVGHDRWVLKTGDGGKTWNAIYSINSDEDLRYVQFLSSSVGYAIGERGIILKSTDGGYSWAHQKSGTSSDLWGGFFLDANTGWAVGDNGIVLRTTDGGNKWVQQPTGTNRDIQSIVFADENVGWLVGDEGLVMRTTTGGAPESDPPVFTCVDEITVEEGVLFSYTATAVDPYGYPLTYSFSNVPSWIQISGVTLSGTATKATQDTSFTIHVENGYYSIEQKVTVIVQHPNSAPRLTSPTSVKATEDVPFAYVIQTEDADGDAVSVTVESLPSWLSLQNLTLTGTPREGDSDTGFKVILSDGEDTEDTWVNINVIPVNDPPEIISPKSCLAVEGVPFLYTARAHDVDSDVLSFAFSGFPSWLSASDSSITGTPAEGDVDTLFTVIVSDGELTDTLQVSIHVQTINDLPVWTSSNAVIAIEDEPFSYHFQAYDPEGEPITYTFPVLPSWLSPADTVLIGTPLEGATDTSMVLIASDGLLCDTLKVDIQVIPINDFPVLKNFHTIEISNIEIYAANLDTCVEDPDDALKDLTWSVSCPIPEVSITLQNRALFVISLDWTGETQLTFVVTDTHGASDSVRVNLNVSESSDVTSESNSQIPTRFELGQNYPNPFNPTTTISYAIPFDARVEIEAYNTKGERVDILLSCQLKAGYHELQWNAEWVAAGIYFITMRGPDFIQTRKCVLIK